MPIVLIPEEENLQSKHSPSVVSNAEPIAYVLIDPLTRKGSVTLISKTKLKDRQLSVCRAAHCSSGDAKAAVVDVLIAKDNSRVDEGYVWAECSEIRSLKLDPRHEDRAFCVIDDGFEHYKAHAVIGYIEPSDGKLRNHREAARGNLLKLLERRGYFTDWDTWTDHMLPDDEVQQHQPSSTSTT